jgi:hypothetical protein
LYTSCVLELRPSVLFNDMTLFIKKKKIEKGPPIMTICI